MKKHAITFIALFLCAALFFCLSACNNAENNTQDNEMDEIYIGTPATELAKFIGGLLRYQPPQRNAYS